MVASAGEFFSRLFIAPGEIVLKHTRLVRIEAPPSKAFVRVRDLATGLEENAALADLRGRSVFTDAARANQLVEALSISHRVGAVGTHRHQS